MLERINKIKKLKRWLKDKKAIEIEMLGWWLIGLGVLVVLMIGIFVLKGKGEGAIEFIKNIFRFKG